MHRRVVLRRRDGPRLAQRAAALLVQHGAPRPSSPPLAYPRRLHKVTPRPRLQAIGIFTTSVVVPTLVIELNNRIATDLKDGGCYASLSCDQPFEGEKAAKAGFDTLLGVAASVATAAAAFAITGGGCECVPPIPVLWCINMGSSAAAGFCALMAFILFGMAEFFTLLSLVKARRRGRAWAHPLPASATDAPPPGLQANDLTLVASLIIAFFLLLKILLDSVYVLTTMLPGLKLVAFFVGQARPSPPPPLCLPSPPPRHPARPTRAHHTPRARAGHLCGHASHLLL